MAELYRYFLFSLHSVLGTMLYLIRIQVYRVYCRASLVEVRNSFTSQGRGTDVSKALLVRSVEPTNGLEPLTC